MQIGVIIFVILLAILMESSLLAWPFLVWLLWWWSDQMEMKYLVWIALLSGAIVDVLNVKTVGLTSLGLLVFLFILGWVKKNFEEMPLLEWALVVISSLVLSYVWGYWHGVMEGVIIVGMTLLIMMIASIRGGHKDLIKLK